jgi:hypothetical protein
MKKMTTRIFLTGAAMLVTVLTSMNTVKAQAYEKGAKQINLGVGFGSPIGSGLGTATSSIPPISASFEYGVTDNISAGGYVGYTGSTYTTTFPFGGGDFKSSYTYTIVGVRGSYHFATSKVLDPYAGVMLGYNIASVSVEYPASWNLPKIPPIAASGVAYSVHLGARYMFTDNIGAFAELGYGIAYINVGLALKF